MGYRVVVASDGVAGFKMVCEERPDLAIIDIRMPRQDGYSLVREIKAEPASRDLPVVVVTAAGDMTELFYMEGVSLVVQKPVSGDEIFGRIRSLID